MNIGKWVEVLGSSRSTRSPFKNLSVLVRVGEKWRASQSIDPQPRHVGRTVCECVCTCVCRWSFMVPVPVVHQDFPCLSEYIPDDGTRRQQGERGGSSGVENNPFSWFIEPRTAGYQDLQERWVYHGKPKHQVMERSLQEERERKLPQGRLRLLLGSTRTELIQYHHA